jgi:hypothetical protein
LQFVNIQVGRHHIRLAIGLVGDYLVCEIQELPAATRMVVAGFHLAAEAASKTADYEGVPSCA